MSSLYVSKGTCAFLRRANPGTEPYGLYTLTIAGGGIAEHS
ncbi:MULTISPECIES: hypothetical protein [unclassified Streptomyces]|nr:MULTISPECIES: hypothetical protein [unclassified Streptomyces]